jgi:hypothetical protein
MNSRPNEISEMTAVVVTNSLENCKTNENELEKVKQKKKKDKKNKKADEEGLSNVSPAELDSISITEQKNEINSERVSPRSHRNDEPDIHPELTLKQLQNPAESFGRRPGSRSHVTSFNGFSTSGEPLEINEMFDFCGRRSRSRLRDERRLGF